MNSAEISARRIDLMQELGNIGTGSAMTALSALLNRPLTIGLPTVEEKDCGSLGELIRQKKNAYLSVSLRVSGDARGEIAILLSPGQVQVMCQDLISGPDQGEMIDSMLCECGNIMGNAYLNALAAMSGMRFTCDLPRLNRDKRLTGLWSGGGDETDSTFMIETSFHCRQETISSFILFHFDTATAKLIWQRMLA